ncbi:unnamed protein product [Amoebophrya sp. A120]|nr:unnamed protein product [Amoebophrya sp. A120]|eukprot:GSA120T00022592001.1
MVICLTRSHFTTNQSLTRYLYFPKIMKIKTCTKKSM